jgi:hypothetical protein
MAVNLNVYPPLSSPNVTAGQQLAATAQQMRQAQQGQAGFVTGSGVNPATNVIVTPPRRGLDLIPPLAPAGWDCFDKGCNEADFRCNQVLPGTAVYNPCIGKWINPYNTFPYLHVVDFPGRGGRCHRRYRC